MARGDGLITGEELHSSVTQELDGYAEHLADYANPHATTAEQLGAIPLTQKGVANGVATLGLDGLVPATQLGDLAGVAESVANLAYDMYSVQLDELYADYFYNSTAPVGSSKAVMVNGFRLSMDTDLTLSTVNVVQGSNFAERVFCVAPALSSITPISATNSAVSMGEIDNFDYPNLSVLIDGNEANYTSFVTSSTGYYYTTILFDLGSIRSIEKFQVKLGGGSGSSSWWNIINFFKHSTNGSAWSTSGFTGIPTPKNDNTDWHSVNFTGPTNVRYVLCQLNARQGGSGGATWSAHEARALYKNDLYIPCQHISPGRPLTFNPSKIVGYFSDNTPTGTSINYYVSTNGGTTWTPGTYVSTRTDYKVATCVEREFHFNNLPAGNSLVVKAELIPTSGMSGVTPSMSRYGLFIQA